MFSAPVATNDGAIVNFSENNGTNEIDGHTFVVNKSKKMYIS